MLSASSIVQPPSVSNNTLVRKICTTIKTMKILSFPINVPHLFMMATVSCTVQYGTLLGFHTIGRLGGMVVGELIVRAV